MTQVYMKYGIDLGTTNSSLCKLEGGNLVVKKTDTMKDTMPSVVSFTRKKQVRVGDQAYNDLKQGRSSAARTWKDSEVNVYTEFKRTMGLDTEYYSSYMDETFTSEQLSAEVLKALKSFNSGETIRAAVVTIPAKFKAEQISATKRAAELAGIVHCELLQEPIAASIAYGLNVVDQESARWLVFDFGGGTFDAALVEMKDRVIKVVDTEGDNYLGGKNLDSAIIQEILLPYLKENYKLDSVFSDEHKLQILRDSLKSYAEQAKNQLSFKLQVEVLSELDEFGTDDEGNEIELDLIVTREQLEKVTLRYFQRAIDIVKELLDRNSITGKELTSLVLVGGPTYSPLLRRMLKEQVSEKLDTSLDPLTVVAKGAAQYAGSILTEQEKPKEKRNLVLDIRYESKTLEDSETIFFKLSKDSTFHANSKFKVEFLRTDNAWTSGLITLSKDETAVELNLQKNKNNTFEVKAYDIHGNLVTCSPREINILQGIIIGDAVLPYNLGMEAIDQRGRDIFLPLEGLEKNQPLPAVGRTDGLTTSFLGIERRRGGISIPIYQGEYGAAGTSSIYNDLVTEVTFTYKDIKKSVPPYTPLSVQLFVDRSQIMKVVVELPSIGVTLENVLDIPPKSASQKEEIEDWFQRFTEEIEALEISEIYSEKDIEEYRGELAEIELRMDTELDTEDGRAHLLADLRRLCRQIEEKENQWFRTEYLAVKEQFKEFIDKEGLVTIPKYETGLRSLEEACEEAEKKNDLASIKLLQQTMEAFMALNRPETTGAFLQLLNSNFMALPWSSRPKARRLLDKAIKMQGKGDSTAVDELMNKMEALLPLDFSELEEMLGSDLSENPHKPFKF